MKCHDKLHGPNQNRTQLCIREMHEQSLRLCRSFKAHNSWAFSVRGTPVPGVLALSTQMTLMIRWCRARYECLVGTSKVFHRRVAPYTTATRHSHHQTVCPYVLTYPGGYHSRCSFAALQNDCNTFTTNHTPLRSSCPLRYRILALNVTSRIRESYFGVR